MTITANKIGLFGAVAFISTIAATSAGAQTNTGESSSALDTAPICMSRPMANVAQVRRQDRGRAFGIVAVEGAAEALEAKGFTRSACEAVGLAQAAEQRAWRDEICELVGAGNEAVQKQLERAYGEKPSVLCALAEQVAGPWEPTGQEQRE